MRQRDDDTEEAVERRLELYERETVPIVEYYRALGLLDDRRRCRRGRRGVRAARQGLSTSSSRSGCRDGPAQDRRPDRADAARGRGRGRDARGVHARRGAGRDDGRSRRARPATCSTGATPARTSSATTAFPAVACISPNEVIVHGIPGPRVLDDGRHRLDRLRGDHRGLARRRRDHGSGGRGRRRVAAPDGRHPGRARRRRSPRPSTGNRLGDVGAAAERRGQRRRVRRSCASTSATASAPPCTRSPTSRTTGRRAGG